MTGLNIGVLNRRLQFRFHAIQQGGGGVDGRILTLFADFRIARAGPRTLDRPMFLMDQTQGSDCEFVE